MSLTLNQIITRLERLALSHKQLNHFYFGDMVEWLAKGDVTYPAVFCDMSVGVIDKAEKQVAYDFDVWFCDLADVAESSKRNEVEVMSDLSSIAQDYKAMLAFTGYQDDWDIVEKSPMEFFKEKFEDIVIAVKLSVTIAVKFDSNRCQVPAENVEFEPPIINEMIVSNYIHTGTGLEGNTITVGSLSNKTVLMLFKGDKLLQPTIGTPNENQYKFLPLSGNFLFGTDIEENQIIQILNR